MSTHAALGTSISAIGLVKQAWTPPFKSDALFGLDGTIITVGADKYFKDKISTRNFLITGYDFDSAWEMGFPYKSAATISAPAGDAALIAADINNFLYAGDGTPNAIPVISLFQDVDYEHKLFCKHIAQVVDGNGIETSEAKVLEIVMYANVKASADLTTCQTYFSVPAESTGNNVRWVMPTGSDASATGYKAAPWLTMLKAVETVDDADLVYVKSFDPYRGNGALKYLYVNKNCNVKAIGRNVLRAVATATSSYRSGLDTPVLFENCYIIPDSTHSSSGMLLTKGVLLVFNKIYLQTGVIVEGAKGGFKELNNSIFKTANTGNLIQKSYGTNDYIINGCLFQPTSNVTCLLVSNNFGKATIKNNKLKGTCLYGVNVVDTINKTDIFGNIFNIDNAAHNHIEILTSTDSSQIDAHDNTFIISAVHSSAVISISNSTTKQHVINNNRFSAVSSTPFVCVFGSASYLKVANNIFSFANITEATGACVLLSNPAATIATSEISNNKVISKRTGDYNLMIGAEATSANDNKVTLPIISKNYIKGRNAYTPSANLTIHGAFIGFHKDGEVSYNNIWGTGYGVVIKGSTGTVYTQKGVCYNVFNECQIGSLIKGPSAVNYLNNTVFNKNIASSGMLQIRANTGGSEVNDCIVKNNIFIYLGAVNINLIENYGTDSIFDYNIYYCPNSVLSFDLNGDPKTFAQWQALGFDTHSIVLTDAQYLALFTDPDNGDFSLKAGSVAIGAGVTLDAAYDDGLDASTNWGSDTQLPVVVTKQQGAAWDIGAYVH